MLSTFRSLGVLVRAGHILRPMDDIDFHLETAVLSALALVPVVGGSLSVIAERTRERSRANIAEAGRAAIEEIGDADLLVERLRDDERLAYLFLNALEAAERTALRGKRRLLGRVIGRAAKDAALLDESELLAAALRDLDAPHLQALADVEQALKANRRTQPLVVVNEIMQKYPAPIRAALRRHGLVKEVTTYDYAGMFDGLTDFGSALLEDIRRADAEADTQPG